MNAFTQNSQLTIELQEAGVTNAQVIVTDITGKAIFNAEKEFFGGKTALDISSYPAGIYVVSVKSATQNFSQKVSYAGK